MRLALLLPMLLFASAAAAEPDANLLADLRQGGYVLFLRHTSTDFSQNDSRSLGEHLKRLKIPIGEVLASPFCRTMELAGPPYLAEGEIAVVRPSGNETFSVIARIRLTDW